MFSVAIVGIMVTVAIPQFQKYKANAKVAESFVVKVAESFVVMDAIEKGQVAFYLEQNEFRRLFRSPTFPYSNDLSDSVITVQDTQDLQDLGYPLSVGDKPQFAFLAIAGKTDGSGNDVLRSADEFHDEFGNEGKQYQRILSQRSVAPLLGTGGGGTQNCNPIINANMLNGLQTGTKTNYDWVVLVAYSNFREMDCTGA